MSIVYLNGQFIPQEQATVSVLDRGILFGDGVYEAIPVYQGHFFGLHEHISRLEESLRFIRINPPLSIPQWEEILQQLLVLNNMQNSNQSIYVQVTRGAEPIRSHLIPTHTTPTVFAICFPPRQTSQEHLNQGLAAITLEDRRRNDCHIKALNLLPNIMAYQEAHDAGCAEAIFIRNGHALEGTSSNLFIVKDGVLKTPPLNTYILGGVTRSVILDLAKQHQIPHEEISISEKSLHEADEIWLTGSIKEIYPIVKLNNRAVGDGKVGSLWHTVMDLYHQYIDKTVQQLNDEKTRK